MLTARARAGQPDRIALPLHPVLAAAYPVVFLFAANVDDQVALDPLWLPLVLAVGAALLALAVLLAVRREPLRAGLVTTVLVVSFFGYGHARNLLADALPDESFLLAIWVAGTLAGVVVAWTAGTWARAATTGLNVMTALLLAVSLTGALAPFVAARVPVDASGQRVDLPAPSEDADTLPDVYYLIFDRYARGDVLRDVYGYDNAPFLDALRERGFYVAHESYANYFKTPLSLVSSLNMDFLDAEELQEEQRDGADREPIHRRLLGSLAVPAALSELGYTYHHVANWWQPSSTNADADVVYRDSGPTEFSTELLETTLISAAWQAEEIEPFDWRVYRSHHEYQLSVLRNIGALPGPKYVFAHLLLPHEPYVFDADGSMRTEEEVAAMDERESYRRQLTHLNGQIVEIVDRILAASEREPIIIIQADEGPFPPRYRADEIGFDWRDATLEEVREKAAILNAYRLPGVTPEEAGLYPSITPVNSFRIVFNTYFGSSLPLLPDRIWGQVSQEDFFEFFEITDRLD